MIAPNAETIEMAADNLKSVPDFIQKSQIQELQSFGDVRAQGIGASGLTEDFKVGYALGLQTARMILATSAVLAIKGVDPLQVL
jgi:hypothetical protein